MMRLVWRNLRAHWLRVTLTVLSVAVAVCLLCVLRAGIVGLESAVTAAARNRLWVQSAVSLFVNLPLSYEQKIAATGGVDRVCKFQWFGATYRDNEAFFAQFGVDPESFAACYPEMEIVEGSYEAFRQNRAGCIVGADLMRDFGWRLGQTVPLQGTIFVREGDAAWEFTIEAVYRAKTTAMDQKTVYFDFGYLQESLEAGAASGPPGSGVYLIALEASADPTQVMADVDLLFENGPQRVQTTTEAEFNRQFVSMLGNVPLLLTTIGSGVLFAIFFAVLNTMLAVGRERTRSFGILKAVGFSDRFVVQSLLVEALVICIGGGLLGAGLAIAMETSLQRGFAGVIQSFAIEPQFALTGIGIAALVGVIAGLAPGWRAGRLTPVQAFRSEV